MALALGWLHRCITNAVTSPRQECTRIPARVMIVWAFPIAYTPVQHLYCSCNMLAAACMQQCYSIGFRPPQLMCVDQHGSSPTLAPLPPAWPRRGTSGVGKQSGLGWLGGAGQDPGGGLLHVLLCVLTSPIFLATFLSPLNSHLYSVWVGRASNPVSHCQSGCPLVLSQVWSEVKQPLTQVISRTAPQKRRRRQRCQSNGL